MAFGTYAKGSRYERELIEEFKRRGYSVIRAAGSGVGTPSPDILLFRKGRSYGFECKAWDRTSLGLEKEKIRELRAWEENTGITTMIAWRVSREGWYFIYLNELEERKKTYTITLEKARRIGRDLEHLLKYG